MVNKINGSQMFFDDKDRGIVDYPIIYYIKYS
jgi:hypothetical protein